ncbi:hypothetical protein PF006_g22572 [Phytophthora fragariae]|nr:hypothetical protein PF006_g22572 [Phytophthora fragariae]
MNKMFQVREFYSFLVFSFLCMQQFRTSVRVLPYPNWRVVRNTVIVAFLTVAVLYGLALLIGFPVPFSLVISVPPWVGFITIFMANEWLRLIQENPGTGTMVFNTMKVLMCEVLLIVVYPPYFYVFTTLSKTGQMFFASRLPVIKLIMRNIFTMTVVHLSDEMPEVVVFISEVFNALFVSYCLQNSPSIGTTLIVTAALLGQLALSLRDINEAVQRTGQVESRLSEDHSDPGYIIMKARRTGRNLSALQPMRVFRTGTNLSFLNLPHRAQVPTTTTATMAKFVFFAAILLVVGVIQLAQAEDIPQDFAPFDTTEGSGFVNTTLEERCCL